MNVANLEKQRIYPNHPDFYTKDAPRMAAIMAMVKQLGEARPAVR